MTSQSPAPSRRFPTIPSGEIVGSFETYERAQAAVDQLARADFPLSDVSILGSNLKSVERVTGKMNAGRAALAGLLSGIMLGLFVGLVVLIMSPESGLATLASVMLVAIGFSVLWNLIGHLVNPRKKEFTSVMQVLAAHFDVVVAPNHAGRARQILGTQSPLAQAASPAFVPQAAAPATHPAPASAPASEHASASASAPAATAAPAAGQPADGAQTPAAPAEPARTYAEAQEAMRRERERELEQQRRGEAPRA